MDKKGHPNAIIENHLRLTMAGIALSNMFPRNGQAFPHT